VKDAMARCSLKEGASMFTVETRRALASVADQLALDAGPCSPREMAELVLDADRLKTGGYPAAFDEVHRLIETHGYGKVELAAARVLNF
jgi:hypothetical protein